MDKIDTIIAGVLEREGGYVNHPADRGGATNWGVTLATLRSEGAMFDYDFDNDGDVDEVDVRALPRDTAGLLLRRRYAERPGFTKLPDDALVELCVDASVNHGPKAAVQQLQRAVGVSDDGQLGPVTLAAVKAALTLPRRLHVLMLAERGEFYGQIVTRDSQLRAAREAGFRLQAEFAYGWAKRLAELFKAIA